MARIYFTNKLNTNSYEVGQYFPSIEARNTYFNIPNIFNNSINFNFDLGDGLTTSIVFSQNSFPSVDLLQVNYCIIEANNTYLFYFINSQKYISHNQYRLYLELDVVTTYFPNLVFNKSFINRAHVNRFKVENNNLVMNFEQNSLLNKNSNSNRNKICKGHFPLDEVFYSSPGVENVQATVNMHGVFWVYLFTNNDPNSLTYYTYKNTVVEQPFNVYVYPCYLGSYGKSIYIGEDIIPVNNFLTLPEDLLIGAVISKLSPFHDVPCTSTATSTTFSDTNYFNLVYAKVEASVPSSGSRVRLVRLDITPRKYKTNVGDLLIPKVTFTKSEIINNEDVIKTSTECHKKPIITINLTNGLSTSKEYGLNELNLFSNEISCIIGEIPYPSVTYQYGYVESGIRPMITSSSDKSWGGMVGSQDNSLIYAKDQLSLFMSNNKNFYKKFYSDLGFTNFQNLIGMLNSAVSAMISAGTASFQFSQGATLGASSYMNSANQIASSGTFGAISNIASVIQSKKNMEYMIDDVQNSPDVINSINGQPLLTMVNDNVGYFIDIYESLESEKEFIASDEYEYGINLGIWDNPINYINTRKIFNYISCEIHEVWTKSTLALPSYIKAKVKDILHNGIRLFNEDLESSIFYSQYKENYEKYIDNLEEVSNGD